MAWKRVEVPKKKPGNGWWSDKTRMDLVTAYVILGSVRLAAAQVGVPEHTVRHWRMAPWWKEAEDEIRRSSKLALSGKLTELVARTFTALEDRVANGDYIYDAKLHEFVRKPINALAANKIIGDMVDRAQMLEKAGTTERINEEGIQQRLDKLREELRSFTKGYIRPEGDIIDVLPEPPIRLTDNGSGTSGTSHDTSTHDTPHDSSSGS